MDFNDIDRDTESDMMCGAVGFCWQGPAKVWEETLLALQVQGSAPGTADGEEIAAKAKANIAAP